VELVPEGFGHFFDHGRWILNVHAEGTGTLASSESS
jgi:hypothetical protein